ncbi:hypothetical protein LY11_04003 [Pedobacter cryoconitis]|uniref:Uncharacterized protein n=1 Tax=Pedobacter cryoconitis TaxID=188932 RepID=A0A327SAN5_9SPHI|nr:hypothetical protein LY11_04003 [Pedobacter cryoconitis]
MGFSVLVFLELINDDSCQLLKELSELLLRLTLIPFEDHIKAF